MRIQAFEPGHLELFDHICRPVPPAIERGCDHRQRRSPIGCAYWLGTAADSGDGRIGALDGGDPELAELIKDLVAAGAPVCEVQEMVETLERLYSRISSGEVM